MFGAIKNPSKFRGKAILFSLMVLILSLWFSFHGANTAAIPTGEAERADIIGKPTALVVHSGKAILSGPNATQQLVISGKYGDGSIRDLTPFASYSLGKTGIVSVSTEGFLLPIGNGETVVTVNV